MSADGMLAVNSLAIVAPAINVATRPGRWLGPRVGAPVREKQTTCLAEHLNCNCGAFAE